MKIIPAILTASEEDLLRKLAFLAGRSKWVQIDFVDDKFAGQKTIRPEQLHQWPSLDINIECHLMVANPFGWVQPCEQILPHRLVAQVETVGSQIEFVERTLAEGIETGFALELTTPLDQLQKEAAFNSQVIILLGVPAGQSGQKLHPQIFSRLAELRQWRQQLGAKFLIGVDGGVKPQYFAQLARQGADLVYLNSALWQTNDWLATWRKIQRQLATNNK